jgi:enoyl-CoA hydratase/carnithine racemase
MWMVLSAEGFGADEAVATGFALAQSLPGRVVDEALERAQALASHGAPALVANKRLLRRGWAERIVEAWAIEKEAMLALAAVVGPFGRSPTRSS